MCDYPQRVLRPLLSALVVLGCAEGAPPTQPSGGAEGVLAAAPRASSELTPTAGTGMIYACFIVGKGIVYRIKVAGTPDECAKNDVQFTIDQGVPGPEGPEGPQGPQGEVGPRGPGGPVSGMTYHTAAVTLPASGQFSATCPAGKSVFHFGWDIPPGSTASPIQISRSRPSIGVGQMLWLFAAAPGTQYNFFWTCVFAEPYTIG